jgi:two-component system, sensor histidine kinase and response regulator
MSEMDIDLFRLFRVNENLSFRTHSLLRSRHVESLRLCDMRDDPPDTLLKPHRWGGSTSRTGEVGIAARILLVEDDAVNQDLAARMLKRLGCHVTTAVDGADALRCLGAQTFDLVLMDCEMPVMDGFAATSAIRRSLSLEVAGSRSRLPIIALTSHDPAEVRARCLAAGMDEAIGKPISATQLSACLTRWLSHASLAQREATHSRASDTGGNGDDARLADATVRDPLVLARIVPQFTASALQTAEAIRLATAANDLDAIWRAAHRLKSSAAWLGVTDLARSCEEIETRARRMTTLPSDHLLEVLDAAIAAALSALRASGEAPA